MQKPLLDRAKGGPPIAHAREERNDKDKLPAPKRHKDTITPGATDLGVGVKKSQEGRPSRRRR